MVVAAAVVVAAATAVVVEVVEVQQENVVISKCSAVARARFSVPHLWIVDVILHLEFFKFYVAPI